MDVFIIGSKGIPAKYGGFETFVDELTRRKQNESINYHISCLAQNNEEFIYNDSRCFNVKTPNIGSAQAVLYDLYSINVCLKYIKKNKLNNSVIYILACRIGPFLKFFKKRLEKLGVQVLVNPDGQEWKRSKWNK
ncbi:DUF1972 domain-containing protein, partial [Bacillus circulans]|uniref:DUF1972 domain-containing protein n=1 Tax=Niallia circulans TaxID=1397 RepID=UPI00155F6C8F